MEILIVGNKENLKEARRKFGGGNQYAFAEDHAAVERVLSNCDVVFDFIIQKNSSLPDIYEKFPSVILFVDTTLKTLLQLGANKFSTTVFGFCGMQTFLDREILEVSVSSVGSLDTLESICEKLSTSFRVVQDQVGMVTPRVIGMIINEAYFTLEEGTATREDIDLAMKLGTNYPYGPFEWCDRIGKKNVIELLKAMKEDTQDPRYTICHLLLNS